MDVVGVAERAQVVEARLEGLVGEVEARVQDAQTSTPRRYHGRGVAGLRPLRHQRRLRRGVLADLERFVSNLANLPQERNFVNSFFFFLLNLHSWNGRRVKTNRSTFQLLEGRKEMFHLTMHSTHFIYGYMVLEGRKEMFHLTMHSTHFIYGYMVLEGRKEMFHLTMHSTHFIYGYMVLEGRKEMFHLTMHSTHFIYVIWCWKEGRKCFI